MGRGRTAWGLLALLAVTAGAAAQPTIEPSTGVVVGGSYALAAGYTMEGDLVVIGTALLIAPGARLDGDLTAVGGHTLVDGTVTGTVNAFGGALTLGDTAHVQGDVRATYAAFEPTVGARIEGVVEGGREPPVLFSLPASLRAPADTAMRVAVSRSPLDGVVRALGLGILAALVTAALPARTGRVRDAMVRAPLRAGLDGLLTLLVAVVVLALVALTIVGIPVALAGATLVYAVALFGWIAFGGVAGAWLERTLRRSWSPPVRAGIGTFAVVAALLLLGVVPPLAGLLGFALTLVGLGAARRTRLGGRERPRRRAPAPPTPAPPG